VFKKSREKLPHLCVNYDLYDGVVPSNSRVREHKVDPFQASLNNKQALLELYACKTAQRPTGT